MYKGAITMNHPLPRGWREFQIKDICSINYGKGLGKNNIVEGNIPVYSSGGIIGYHNESLINSKGVIIGRKGNAGSVFYSNSPFFCIDTAFYVEANDNIDLKFLYYKLISIKLERHKIDSAVPGINRDTIYSISITVPPIDEQKRIADILSTFDDLIENLKKLIEKKEIYKKGVMQRVLSGEVRFNGFTDEWKTVRIGDICEYKNGNSFENYIDENGKLFLITLDSITIDGRLKNNHKKINIDTKELLSKNDIVMILSDIAHGYFLGLTAVIDKDNCYVLNQRVALLKPNNIIVNSYFLSKLININQKYFKKYGQGSSQQNLQKKSVENFIVKIPSLEEQNKIAELLTLIDKDIEILKQLLHLRKLQKKGVMQKLLTGEVRV